MVLGIVVFATYPDTMWLRSDKWIFVISLAILFQRAMVTKLENVCSHYFPATTLIPAVGMLETEDAFFSPSKRKLAKTFAKIFVSKL